MTIFNILMIDWLIYRYGYVKGRNYEYTRKRHISKTPVDVALK